MVIDKKTFVDAVNEVKRAHDYQEGLNEFYKKHCSDGYLWQPDCSDALITVLETAMGLKLNEDGQTDLSCFCYELDFGRKFKPGDVKDDDGTEPDFSSAETLYDYLTAKSDKAGDETG